MELSFVNWISFLFISFHFYAMSDSCSIRWQFTCIIHTDNQMVKIIVKRWMATAHISVCQHRASTTRVHEFRVHVQRDWSLWTMAWCVSKTVSDLYYVFFGYLNHFTRYLFSFDFWSMSDSIGCENWKMDHFFLFIIVIYQITFFVRRECESEDGWKWKLFYIAFAAEKLFQLIFHISHCVKLKATI